MTDFIYKHRKTNKRYMLIFQIWNTKKSQITYSEYNTMNECNEEIELIKECYSGVPKYNVDTNPDGIYWGYVLLDFDNENILKWGNDCLNGLSKHQDKNSLKTISFVRKVKYLKNINGITVNMKDGFDFVGVMEKMQLVMLNPQNLNQLKRKKL